MSNFKDLKGQIFNHLKVIGLSGKKRGTHLLWSCKCLFNNCGNITLTTTDDLRSGKKVSCGCYRAFIRIKHGFYGTRLERIFMNIDQRINNPKNKGYKYYGEKKISNEFTSLERFIEWSNENGYKPELILDRINKLGNYSEDNCRWRPKNYAAFNKGVRHDSKSKITGVLFSKTKNCWIAKMQVNGKTISKSFSVKQHGMSLAKKLCIQQRKMYETQYRPAELLD